MADSTQGQKSEVHATTDDASTSPASNFERGAADADIERNPKATAPDEGAGDAPPAGPGAGDSSSGGGAGAGVPGGGTDMRTNGAFGGGDVRHDREKLFPDAGRDPNAAAPPGATVESDETDDGGPLRLRTDDAGSRGRKGQP